MELDKIVKRPILVKYNFWPLLRKLIIRNLEKERGSTQVVKGAVCKTVMRECESHLSLQKDKDGV